MAFPVKTAAGATSGDASGNITFATITMTEGTILSLQVAWTGQTTGVLILQVSNDGTNFVDTAEVWPSNPAGATGSTAEVWSGFGYKFARLYYDWTSNTGAATMTCYAEVKK